MIYFDNSATTFPKPECVPDAVYNFIKNDGTNISRGSYSSAYKTEEMVYETRQMLADFFGEEDCRNVVFTKNITESLNMILKGFLNSGDHVLVSSMEHNAVMRPIVQLEEKGVEFDRIPCSETGELQIAAIEHLIRSNTKAIVMTHASNVSGTVLPIRQVGEICKKHNLKFIVDSAQTAGVLPIHMVHDHIDALAFTGHKSLLGPQGIGGAVIKPEMAKMINPIISGGTGSISHSEKIPDFMPDKLEAGTMNLPGIAGLNASLKWIIQKGTESILKHEMKLTEPFLSGCEEMKKEGLLNVVGISGTVNRVGVVSINTDKMDLSELSQKLDEQYEIATRVGLHCAPNAHKTLNTFPVGTVRFSFGWNNTQEEVDICLKALKSILSEGR